MCDPKVKSERSNRLYSSLVQVRCKVSFQTGLGPLPNFVYRLNEGGSARSKQMLHCITGAALCRMAWLHCVAFPVAPATRERHAGHRPSHGTKPQTPPPRLPSAAADPVALFWECYFGNASFWECEKRMLFWECETRHVILGMLFWECYSGNVILGMLFWKCSILSSMPYSGYAFRWACSILGTLHLEHALF